MSTTADRQRHEIDLATDLGADVPSEAPRRATIEIEADGDRRTVSIEYGPDEWVLEFADGECVDRDPPTRPLPQWINDAMELVRGELR
ncbi:hypothetical protein [Natrarchaeobius oligotrophus]|uniref:Uncharacterized protein n=1 Tax=Natrarchaeobius chitinivorans TaxID=1679083 RepID=A0A3N6MBA3_NATCH|nr:hypothetical protein [Natrarchaeobius chitinivorans]RQG93700.1 hypothetical protein EA472_22445 [Natrarchaeobius chitinivorans]